VRKGLSCGSFRRKSVFRGHRKRRLPTLEGSGRGIKRRNSQRRTRQAGPTDEGGDCEKVRGVAASNEARAPQRFILMSLIGGLKRTL